MNNLKKIAYVSKLLLICCLFILIIIFMRSILISMSTVEIDPYYMLMKNISGGTILVCLTIISIVFLQILIYPLLKYKSAGYFIEILLFIFILLIAYNCWYLLGTPFTRLPGQSENIITLQIEHTANMARDISIQISYLSVVIFLIINYSTSKYFSNNHQEKK
jgi:hypothetical protein